MELVVLSQNILGGGPLWSLRRKRLCRLIRELRPDIVGLQEVRAPNANGSGSQAHEIAAILGDYHVEFAPARVAADGSCEGVAVLYRHNVVESAVTALTLDNSDRWDRGNQRVVLACLMEVEGVRVQVFATHLSLSRAARERTLAELSEVVSATQARSPSEVTVILGDFNAPPGEQAICRLVEATHEPWVDAWSALHGTGGGHTWPTPWPLRRIDYVFVQLTPSFRLEACHRMRHRGSDHCALWARVCGPVEADELQQFSPDPAPPRLTLESEERPRD